MDEKKPRELPIKNCVSCQKPYQPTSGAQKRCPTCAADQRCPTCAADPGSVPAQTQLPIQLPLIPASITTVDDVVIPIHIKITVTIDK